ELSCPQDGRVAIITGAGRGIGREHALAYARAGASVIVNDFGGAGDGSGGSTTPAEQVVEEIRALGQAAVASYDDVSEPDGAEALVKTSIAEFGRLDVLVNNAGILRDRTLLNTSVEDWDAVVKVHLRGMFLTSKAAGLYWRDQSKAGADVSGRIINTSSGSGLFGNFGQANYAAAKAGIASLTIVSAMELERYGVTVNAIAPVAKTRLTAGAGMDPNLAAGFDPYDPQHVAPLVLWLGSREAGEVTGRVFTVVGGFVGVVEGWNLGPQLLEEGAGLSYERIAAELPGVIDKARPNASVFASHPYGKQ
ncbi:SDR family oxidoreductase, partial [Nocardioides sp.]|uniref:SDR family oxidoreductase n=1 Tax=Nocardioides sp. TaxID=35761 RepID=UPI002736ED00